MTARFSTLIAMLGLLAAGLGSCSLMHDDLAPCPSGVDIDFVYDYNIQRADMFPDHVGSVTVYVFDENNRFITQQEEFNTTTARPLAEHGYRMHLDLAPGTYSFIAIAHQKSHAECLAAPGAKFRRSELTQAVSGKTDFSVTLDRAESQVKNQGVSLDTLWHGMSMQPLTIRDMEEAHQTISLVRDTKNLTISLHQLNNPADIDGDDFDITITAANGRIVHDNSLADDEVLTYTPYARWTTEFTTEGSRDGTPVVLERTAHAALSFNRIMHYASAADNEANAMLNITNRTTGETVARINLPDCLAQGRGAFEYYNYSPQEFLDREHDYKLDFFLKGDTWQYVDLSISVLSWSKRIQRVDL